MIFFTSDHHFFHKNIIEYDGRPFETVEEMDDHLIKQWNAVVSKNDLVYILGDLTMMTNRIKVEALINRLNGRLILIKGNHDYFARKKWARDLFEEVCDYKEINLENYHICMMHYPLASWNRKHYGSINLYGHVHNNPLDTDVGGLRYNVGVCVNDYAPVSWENIKKKLKLSDEEEKNVSL